MSRNNNNFNYNNNPFTSKPQSSQRLTSSNYQSSQLPQPRSMPQQAPVYSGLSSNNQIPQQTSQSNMAFSFNNNSYPTTSPSFQGQSLFNQGLQQQMQYPPTNTYMNMSSNMSNSFNPSPTNAINPAPMQINFPQNYNQFPQLNNIGTSPSQIDPFLPVPNNPEDYFQPNDGEEELDNTKIVTTNEKDTTFDLNQATNLSIRLKKKFIQSSSFQEQTLPMLVSLAVDNLKTNKKTPLDLVCVIDHSGSMNGEKIELVKGTFDYLLEYLDESDRLSIVIFDDSASRLVPLVRATPSNKKKILNTLKTVYARGGTDINLGMTTAFDVLKQRKYFNPVSSIFLLSDGQDGGAQHKVQTSLTYYGISEEVTINTFGFGRDHDPQLMTDIASLRDGNFYFINQLDTVDEAFVDCLGGLISAVAQNVEIKIKPEQSEILQGVDFVKAYGDTSMWSYDSTTQTYTTKMATLISGKQKDYVLEIKIPVNKRELADHEKSIKIASAEAVITGLDNQKIVKKVNLIITLLNEVEEVKDEGDEDDREVMKNFYRVKGAQLMDDARKLADNRKYEEAQKILKSFKEEIGNSFLKEEEFIKNLIKDIEKAVQDCTQVTYESFGKQNMISNQRAQMQQRSNIASANCYQNYAQVAMTNQVRGMKGQQGSYF